MKTVENKRKRRRKKKERRKTKFNDCKEDKDYATQLSKTSSHISSKMILFLQAKIRAVPFYDN